MAKTAAPPTTTKKRRIRECIATSVTYKPLDLQARLLKANRNNVGGSIQVMQNFGGVRIYNNVIDGNLQCKQNQPKPVGGGNVVGGNKEDQCKRL